MKKYIAIGREFQNYILKLQPCIFGGVFVQIDFWNSLLENKANFVDIFEKQ
jgi:hypothetical protein